MRLFPITLRAVTRFVVGALLLVAPAALPGPVHAASRVTGPAATCQRAPRAGRRGSHAPRRPSAARHGRPVPWLKGNLPNVQAQGAFVLDLVDGQELYSRRPDEARPIASISKLAATLTVVDRGLNLDGTTTILHSDAEVAKGGARSRLLEGMTLVNRDLLHAALLGSDNRAIPALGRAVGLDAVQLAAAMTQKVRDLGLRNTRFIEPTGLSPENVSTPRELIDLLRAVMDHPILGEITRKIEYDAHPIGRAPIRYFATYRAAARSNTLVLGAKTGFNNAARYCLVLAARVAGRTVGMAFLGTEGEMTRFGDVARVADWVVAQESRALPHESVVAQAIAIPAPGRMTPVAAVAPPGPLSLFGSPPPASPVAPVATPSFSLPVAAPTLSLLPLATTTPTLATPPGPTAPASLSPPPLELPEGPAAPGAFSSPE